MEKAQRWLETLTRQAPPPPAAPAPTNHGALFLRPSGDRDVTLTLANEEATSLTSAVKIGWLRHGSPPPEVGRAIWKRTLRASGGLV